MTPILLCMMLYHSGANCDSIPTPSMSVIDTLELVMESPPDDPLWWPLWTLA
jgi:hypothetical protein